MLYKGKKSKNAYKKRENRNFEFKKKKILNAFFFLISQGSLNPKIRFLGQKVCSVARIQTDGRTDTQTDRHIDTQTDTKVNTEDTLSGFPEFFLQPIIKDRSNDNLLSVCRYTNLDKDGIDECLERVQKRMPNERVSQYMISFALTFNKLHFFVCIFSL